MKTIIEMAREAAGDDWKLFLEFMPEIHRLAELIRADERNRTWTQEHWTEYERSIAAAEREACAMECIKLAHHWTRLGAWGENNEFHDCAAAIRARGQA